MKTAGNNNIDEVVFEGRNKNYGAYFLRKNNNKIVTSSLIMGVCIMLATTIIPFLLFKEASSVNDDKSVSAEFTNMEAPKTEEEQAPPPPPPPPPSNIEQRVKFTAPVVTTDTVEDTGLLNQDDLNQQSTNTDIDPDPAETNEIVVVEEVEYKVIEQAPPPPFTIVEVMPRFEGGEEAMYAFINSAIIYPKMAKETNISGTVIVSFVVEKDGSISDVHLLKDIGAGCGDEAIRVINSMPKWIPGKQNGIPVRVQFNIPIKFTLL